MNSIGLTSEYSVTLDVRTYAIVYEYCI